MMTTNKNEELKFIIGRFDHYYDSINNKGNLYLTINTFILGGVIGGFQALSQIHQFGFGYLILFIAALFSNLVSFSATLCAIRPFTPKIKHAAESLLFFGDVNRLSEAQWLQQWDSMDEHKWQADLKAQSKQLAKGLDTKFSCLQQATLFIGIQAGCIVLFGIALLITQIQ